ncbi:unnamed protein product [Calypogeia fissa]
MAAVSVSLTTESAAVSPNDLIFALLDYSWFSHHSRAAFGVPEVSWSTSPPAAGVDESELESETASRSSEAVGNESSSTSSTSATDCSTLEPVDNHSQQSTTSDESDKSGSELTRRYSMAESEMRRVFDRFDCNGDGLISVEELHSYMRCCGADVSEVEANSMISSVDLNNDGKVDFEEFLSLYQTRMNGSDGDAIEEDAQKSHGGHDEQDLLDAFRVFDSNEDGKISAQELQAVLLNLGMPEGKSLIRCEAMIRVVDKDGDGHCDIQEFQEMMAGQPF